MSSIAIVSFIPGVSSSWSGSEPWGWSSACRMWLPQAPEPRQRVRRVDHPRAERELLEPEPLALVDEERRRALVDFENETRSCHVCVSLFGQSSLGSNATFSVPSLPAPSAWSIASRQRRSG